MQKKPLRAFRSAIAASCCLVGWLIHGAAAHAAPIGPATPAPLRPQAVPPAPPREFSAGFTLENRGAACQALAHARGLGAPLLDAIPADATSFQAVSEHAAGLARSLPPQALPAEAAGIAALVTRIERNANLQWEHRDTVLQARRALQTIGKGANEFMEQTESVHSEEGAAGSPAPRIIAAGILSALTQRIGKSAVELLSGAALDPDAVFFLGKDIQTFTTIATALRDGSTELRLQPAKTAKAKALLTESLNRIATTRELAKDQVLSKLQSLVAVQEARARMRADAQTLDRWLAPQCFGR